MCSNSVLPIRCDITDSIAIERVLLQGISGFGGIDILVSNAGAFTESQFIDSIQDKNWEQSVELNLNSHMKVLRACVPYLKTGSIHQ